MRGLFTNRAITLQPGQTVSGMPESAQTLHIARGRVWITVEGIRHDYFLSAGDSFTAIPGRLTVIEADREAKIEQRRPSPLHALHGIRSLVAQLTQSMSSRATVQASMHHRTCCDARC